MTTPATETSATLRLPVDRETLHRLQGQGCIECGTTQGLAPAGHRHTEGGTGGRLGWSILACKQHRGEAG